MYTSGTFELVACNNIESQACYTDVLHVMLGNGSARECSQSYFGFWILLEYSDFRDCLNLNVGNNL